MEPFHVCISTIEHLERWLPRSYWLLDGVCSLGCIPKTPYHRYPMVLERIQNWLKTCGTLGARLLLVPNRWHARIYKASTLYAALSIPQSCTHVDRQTDMHTRMHKGMQTCIHEHTRAITRANTHAHTHLTDIRACPHAHANALRVQASQKHTHTHTPHKHPYTLTCTCVCACTQTASACCPTGVLFQLQAKHFCLSMHAVRGYTQTITAHRH